MTQTAEQIVTEIDGSVAVLRLMAAPTNALTRDMRKAVLKAIERADADPGVMAIVLIGDASVFSVGAELSADDRSDPPSMTTLCTKIEACAKPVVAAIGGLALGGGADLALAAHFRIASADARIAWPEIRIGLPPSAGTSQRLPRLLGAGIALDLLLGGQVMSAQVAERRGLVDMVATGPLRLQAIQFARGLLAEGQGPRPVCDLLDGFADMDAFSQALAVARSGVPPYAGQATRRVLALIEAAPLLPFEAGLAMEDDAFETARQSSEARALRHLFLAERRVARFDRQSQTAVALPERIAVLGAGELAVQIVTLLLDHGFGVDWGLPDAGQSASAGSDLDAALDQAVGSGRLTQADRAARRAVVQIDEGAKIALSASLVISTETGEVPLLAKDAVCLTVAPGRVERVGLRLSLPVFDPRMIEVICGPAGSTPEIALAHTLCRRLGMMALRIRSDGLSACAEMGEALQRGADALIDLGSDPYAIDAALEGWGWSLPPFRARDIAGLEVFADGTRGTGARNWSATLLRAGRRGCTAGRGFYRWSESGPERDPGLLAVLDSVRAARTLPAETIRRVLIGAMANEGLRLLERGAVARAADLDVIAVLGLGFPRDRGGPMHAVGEIGLLSVKTAMTGLAHPDTGWWTPHASWAPLIRDGKTFDAL